MLDGGVPQTNFSLLGVMIGFCEVEYKFKLDLGLVSPPQPISNQLSICFNIY